LSSESGNSPLDLGRMRRERQQKLASEMQRQGIDALVLAGTGNVHYATGATWLTSDAGRAICEPAIAIVTPHGQPHLFTPYPEGIPADLEPGRRHGPLAPEFPEGVAELAAVLTDLLGNTSLRVGFDELSAAAHEHLPRLLPKMTIVNAGEVLAPAKLCKTADELECIRRAQRINELAMYDVHSALRPGVRQCDLTGIFLDRIFELGATGNGIDPIWQATPLAIADGPFSVNGDLPFPIPSTDRILRQGELVIVDSGIKYEGYCSDFGRTWLVGEDVASARQRDHFKRWCDVMSRVLEIVRPGTTGLELNRAACKGENDRRPWLDHFYLIHGLGTESAEPPFIGTDLGEDYDESVVLSPGMVLVLEPVIWDDGHGGYRSEELVAVTDTGYRWLSQFPYAPFDTDGRWRW